MMQCFLNITKCEQPFVAGNSPNIKKTLAGNIIFAYVNNTCLINQFSIPIKWRASMRLISFQILAKKQTNKQTFS